VTVIKTSESKLTRSAPRRPSSCPTGPRSTSNFMTQILKRKNSIAQPYRRQIRSSQSRQKARLQTTIRTLHQNRTFRQPVISHLCGGKNWKQQEEEIRWKIDAKEAAEEENEGQHDDDQRSVAVQPTQNVDWRGNFVVSRKIGGNATSDDGRLWHFGETFPN